MSKQAEQNAANPGGYGQAQNWNGLPNFMQPGALPDVLQPVGKPSDDTEAGALFRLAAEQSGAVLAGDLETLKLTPFAVLPVGKRIESLKPILDAYLPRPDRAAGFAVLTTLASFLAHVQRHSDPRRSIIFADGETSRLIAIYDYHSAGTTGGERGMLEPRGERVPATVEAFGAPGEPGWCRHGAIYTCPLSSAWDAWTVANVKGMTPGEFANFLEDRIEDVVAEVLQDSSLARLLDLLGGTIATPRLLIGLARNLQVNVNSSVRQVQNLSTGEVDISYVESHDQQMVENGAGKPARVPSMFAIGVPVYEGGERYQMGVKLRYRVNQNKVTWSFEIHRLSEAAALAFDRVIEEAQANAGVPVLRGTPGNAITVQ